METYVYLRRVTPDQTEVIEFTLKEYVKHITLYDSFENETLEEMVLKEKRFIEEKTNRFFAIYDKSDFIGVVSFFLQQDFYLIRDFYIKDDLRSKGYGGEVLNFLILKARHDKKDLKTLTYKTNLRSIRFLERNRFEKIGTIDDKFIYQLAMSQTQDVEHLR